MVLLVVFFCSDFRFAVKPRSFSHHSVEKLICVPVLIKLFVGNLTRTEKLYNQNSVTQAPMTRLPWLIRTPFEILGNSSISERKEILEDILSDTNSY